MLTLFQESTPFSGKRLNKEISKAGNFTNPIIMPYAFDFTNDITSFESVFYIRNNNIAKFYSNILISVMKEDSYVENPIQIIRTINHEEMIIGFDQVSYGVEKAFPYTYSSDILYVGTESEDKFLDSYIPITKDSNIEIKLSYGYDELSNYEWNKRKSFLLIPYIGNSSTPDTSYLPIRMKVNLFKPFDFMTIRDYFINIVYENESSL